MKSQLWRGFQVFTSEVLTSYQLFSEEPGNRDR